MGRTRLMPAGLVGMLTCSGHAEPPPSRPVTTTGPIMSQFTAMPVAGLPQCREYSVITNVEGKPQPLKGEACRQPDGSWHIAEQPVNARDVYQTVYWPPPGVVVDYDAPWFWAVPFAFSIGFPVFVDVRHHFHKFGDAGRGVILGISNIPHMVAASTEADLGTGDGGPRPARSGRPSIREMSVDVGPPACSSAVLHGTGPPS